MRPTDSPSSALCDDDTTLVDQVGQLVSELQSRDGLLPHGERLIPPLPLEALEPLAPRDRSDPTLDGAVMVPMVRQALGPKADSTSKPIMTRRPSQSPSQAARPRPSTMAYGEFEALHPTTHDRLDGQLAVQPQVLCAIPVSPPAHIVGRIQRVLSSPVSRFTAQRTSLDRPSTDAAMARLPGLASSWVGPKDPMGAQQELDLNDPMETRPARPLGSAQVTAPGLTHIGSKVEPFRVTFHHQPSDEALHGAPGRLGQGDARQTELVSRVMTLVLTLLAAAALLPVHRDGALMAPWAELMVPGSTGFTVAAFGGLLAAMVYGPLERVIRVSLSAFLACGLLLFACLLLCEEVQTGGFAGHPALHALMDAPISAQIVLAMCACVLPTALAWRSLDVTSFGARTLMATGIGLVAYAYVALPSVGIGARGGALILFDAASSSPFMGDRAAALLACGPGLVALLSLVSWARRAQRSASTLAGLYWASLLAPIFALALFSTTADSWASVLGPIQVVTILAAGFLLVPMVLGELLHVVGQSHEA